MRRRAVLLFFPQDKGAVHPARHRSTCNSYKCMISSDDAEDVEANVPCSGPTDAVSWVGRCLGTGWPY